MQVQVQVLWDTVGCQSTGRVDLFRRCDSDPDVVLPETHPFLTCPGIFSADSHLPSVPGSPGRGSAPPQGPGEQHCSLQWPRPGLPTSGSRSVFIPYFTPSQEGPKR